MNPKELRQEYQQHPDLRHSDLDPNPSKQFEQWFGEACAADIIEPNAMSLATATPGGQPFQRTVLLKLFDQRGFVFFTNLESRKACQIAENAQVSLLFPWYPLQRQVNILGKASKVTATESLKYFASRPRGSQLGAWVSRQSSVISSRGLLESKLDELKRKFGQGDIPLPSFWGGFRVVPHSFEFWQGRHSRLHDRFLYTGQNSGEWLIERLAP